ncbi:MAG TPA: hypothetical protein VI911_09010 [Patescibacteria group bacterium]|nr:MAG: hypothetical protein UR43_C0005G0030 [candidate division TM6 bacterium GW2011_GWF2_33_332]HLD91137.1 hypothetical protein [Patescibacteria group bacterium]
MNNLDTNIIYVTKTKDYTMLYAKITAIGKHNVCYDRCKDLNDLNSGLAMEECSSIDDFRSFFEEYKEKPKKVTLYRYLYDGAGGILHLSEWSSEKKEKQTWILMEFTKEIDLE